MSDRILLELFIVIMGVHIVVSVIIAYLKLDAEQRRREVDLKLAEAQGRMMTAKPLNDLLDTVNKIMDFYIANELVLIANGKISEEDRNDILIQYTASISTKVTGNLSSEMIRQFSYYTYINNSATTDENGDTVEDFLTYYIRKTVMTKVALVVGGRTEVDHSAKSKSNQ